MAINRLEEFFLKPHRSSHIEFSRLVPYSSLILTVSCVVIFLYRIYMLEPLVKRFTEQYNHLRQDQQRSLINHYVAASIKLLLIFFAVYPSIMIISGRKDLHSPFAGPKVRYGDILLFVFEIFTAMYIFELFYREKVSYISGAHHIGAIIITQTSIVLFQDTKHLRDAELEFLLCLVWGESRLYRFWCSFDIDGKQDSSTSVPNCGRTLQLLSIAHGPEHTVFWQISFLRQRSSR
jgi:hypothetical protein